MTVQELVFKLLGSVSWLKVERISVVEEQIWVSARSVQKESPCPICGVMSTSIHSHYERTLRDLAWGSFSVCIRLKVRRFRCGQAGCKCRVFTERFVDWVVAYARRINRLSELPSQLGILVGSTTASKVSKLVSAEASPSSTLRQVHSLEVPKIPTQAASPLSVIGVDDFAFKRRKSYGTVIVNLETQKAVDLLPDRTSEGLSGNAERMLHTARKELLAQQFQVGFPATLIARTHLATWLKEHPNIKTIARDRSTEYAKG